MVELYAVSVVRAPAQLKRLALPSATDDQYRSLRPAFPDALKSGVPERSSTQFDIQLPVDEMTVLVSITIWS